MTAGSSSAPPVASDTQASLVEKLTASSSASCDRIAAAHRLNEMFTWYHKRADAERLAGELCSAPLCEALVQLVTGGEELCEIAVHLMLNLCVSRGNAHQLCQSGVLPVLIASLRVAEPQFLLPGLALLSMIAEDRELAAPLLRAGVCKLISSLANKLRSGQSGMLGGSSLGANASARQLLSNPDRVAALSDPRVQAALDKALNQPNGLAMQQYKHRNTTRVSAERKF